MNTLKSLSPVVISKEVPKPSPVSETKVVTASFRVAEAYTENGKTDAEIDIHSHESLSQLISVSSSILDYNL